MSKQRVNSLANLFCTENSQPYETFNQLITNSSTQNAPWGLSAEPSQEGERDRYYT